MEVLNWSALRSGLVRIIFPFLCDPLGLALLDDLISLKYDFLDGGKIAATVPGFTSTHHTMESNK